MRDRIALPHVKHTRHECKSPADALFERDEAEWAETELKIQIWQAVSLIARGASIDDAMLDVGLIGPPGLCDALNGAVAEAITLRTEIFRDDDEGGATP
jgi:hypothetical protein